MPTYRIFEIWKQGKTAINAFLRIPHSWTAELMSHQGFDSLTLDLQHSLIGRDSMTGLLQAMAPGTYPMVRLNANEPEQIMFALDVGVKGLICPMINSAAEAQAFVASCHYPPKGIRSYGSIRANLPVRATYMQDYADDVLTFAQIETRAGLEHVEEIAAVSGLSGLYLGPYDLSIDLGLPKLADFSDPVLMKHVERILKAAQAAGKRTAVHSFKEEDAIRLSKLGFDIVTPLDDASMMLQGTREKLERIRPFVR